MLNFDRTKTKDKMKYVLHHHGKHAVHVVHEYGHMAYFGYAAYYYHGPLSHICGVLLACSVLMVFSGMSEEA